MKGSPLKGRIRDRRLPEILIALHREEATGVLRVSTDSFVKKVYLSSGNVISASSSREDDRLGEMLLKAGKINIRQYEKSVEILKKTGKKQGAIMVELGYLTPRELYWSVKHQVKEIIYSLFQLEDGEYEFIPDGVFEEEIVSMNLPMGGLIYEGLRRINNWTRIRREMPPIESPLRFNSELSTLYQGIDLSDMDREVLMLVDGKRAIKDIIDGASHDSLDVLKSLYLLISMGLVQPCDRIEKAPETADGFLKDLDREEANFIREVYRLHERLDRLSPYELLNAGEGADQETLKRNYYRLVQLYHPDRYYNQPYQEDLKQKLTDLFVAITEAYRRLRSEKPEESVDTAAEAGSSTLQKEAQAQELYRKGLQEYRDGNYWQAAESFRWATRLNPKSARYWSHLSRALSRIPKRLKQAEEALLEAIKLEPFNGEHYADLGLIYLQADLKRRARTHFEKALKFDPRNEKALKGLEKIGSLK